MNKTKQIITATICGISLIVSSVFAQDAKCACGGKDANCQDKTPEWLKRDSLFLSSATESLTEKTGFAPSIVWTGEGWADVSRGSNIESMFDSLFTLGFEQDLSVATKSNGLGRIGVSAFYYTQTNDGALGRFRFIARLLE